MKDYIFKNKVSLFVRLLVLVLPIFLGGCLIISKYSSFNYFNELSHFNINSVFIVFVYIALVPIFINIIFYLYDTFNLIFNYKGSNKKIKALNLISVIAIFLLGMGIAIFVGAISIKHLSFIEIVEYNRYISLSIFLVFLIIDGLTWYSEKIEKAEVTNLNEKEKFDINITFSKESTFLINIPTFLIIFLSLFFIHKLEHIDYYKQMISYENFLMDVQIPVNTEIVELFINGIETGIIMTSIVFSQIIFFFIKTKWSYRIHNLEQKNGEAQTANNV